MKEKWASGVDANKSKGEGRESVGNPGEGGPSDKGQAPLWMATGKGGFINLNGQGDGRVVDLGRDGKPINQ